MTEAMGETGGAVPPLAQVVHVVMPVFRGGVLWERSLASLVQARSLFGDIVISFDGPDREQLAADLLSSHGDDLQPTVLITPVPMSSVEHAVWILDQAPVSSWADSQLVLLLAEDDLIVAETMAAGLDALRARERTALFGTWTTDLLPPPEPSARATSVAVYEATEIAPRLRQIAHRREYTSVSGIALPVRAMRQYYAQVTGAGSGSPLLNGIRTEYFLMTQPGIDCVIQTAEPNIVIQVHPQQEGSVTAPTLMNNDEALFQLWLLMTPQPTRATERLGAALRLAKRVVLHPRAGRRLGEGVRTFRLARHDD